MPVQGCLESQLMPGRRPRSPKADVLDDLFTLFRRRRAPVRARRLAPAESRPRINLTTMGGPIGGGGGDWMPRTEQRIQQPPQYDAAAEAYAQQTARYAEPQQQPYAEHDGYQEPQA